MYPKFKLFKNHIYFSSTERANFPLNMSTLSSGQIESTSQIHRLIPQITKLWLAMSPTGSTDSLQRVSINEGTLTSFY